MKIVVQLIMFVVLAVLVGVSIEVAETIAGKAAVVVIGIVGTYYIWRL
jgi:uncharacterized membrane protein